MTGGYDPATTRGSVVFERPAIIFDVESGHCATFDPIGQVWYETVPAVGDVEPAQRMHPAPWVLALDPPAGMTDQDVAALSTGGPIDWSCAVCGLSTTKPSASELAWFISLHPCTTEQAVSGLRVVPQQPPE